MNSLSTSECMDNSVSMSEKISEQPDFLLFADWMSENTSGPLKPPAIRDCFSPQS